MFTRARLLTTVSMVTTLVVSAYVATIDSYSADADSTYRQTNTAPASIADSNSAAAAAQAMLKTYCASCHGARLKSGGLSFDDLDVANAPAHADVWERVVRKLRAGTMPPAGRPRPDEPTRARFVSFVEAAIDRAAALDPNPGRTEPFHRFNRGEYQNAIRDLLATDVDVADMLPIDDTGAGFDNMAAVLKVSDSLMSQYLSAARKISRAAIGVAASAAKPITASFDVPPGLPQYSHIEGLPIGTRGGIVFRHAFPSDADYDLAIDLAGARAYYLSEDLELLVDSVRSHVFHLPGGKELNERSPEAIAAEAVVASMDPGTVESIRYELAQRKPVAQIAREYFAPAAQVDAVATAMKGVAPAGRTVTVRLPIKAGPHELAATFRQTVRTEAESDRQPFEVADGGGGLMPISQPFVGSVRITGPFNAAGASELPSRRRIFVCHPARAAQETECARTILSTLIRRAYRRPPSAADVREVMAFYTAARRDGEAFEHGIELGLQRILISPHFLFRIEVPPTSAAVARAVAATAPAPNYRISDLDLASRLSFFLWSSIPDDELLNVASEGRLHDPAVLTRQVTRMLADRKAGALTANFAGQWLRLRDIPDQAPDVYSFPDFDDSLRTALARETELFFDSIVRENRSARDLVDADYTFLNERLARHYGIRFVQGSRFRKVLLEPDSPRRGLLGKGSILLVTSNAIRTSPVRRGKWILENILGSPPPRPPANIPPFPEKKPGQIQVRSVRERQAEHRKNPACAQCHSMIDPLGFSLENFDAVGAWRSRDEDLQAIDASGSLPDGTSFTGVAGLRAALMTHPELFVTTLTQKLLQYALGRELASYDMPAVRAVVREAAASDYRFASLASGIVRSTPFTMRRVESAPPGAGRDAVGQ
jgi:mono/diheme cytochrome c family protein